MDYGIRFLSELGEEQLYGKTVFYRPDWNLPLNAKGKPISIFRILQSLPTIKYLLERNVHRIIIGCHLDPWSEIPAISRDSRLSTRIIASRFIELVGEYAIEILSDWDYSEDDSCMFTILENLRFTPSEIRNDLTFA